MPGQFSAVQNLAKQCSNGPFIMQHYLADDLLSMVLLGDVDREGSAEGTLTLGLG